MPLPESRTSSAIAALFPAFLTSHSPSEGSTPIAPGSAVPVTTSEFDEVAIISIPTVTAVTAVPFASNNISPITSTPFSAMDSSDVSLSAEDDDACQRSPLSLQLPPEEVSFSAAPGAAPSSPPEQIPLLLQQLWNEDGAFGTEEADADGAAACLPSPVLRSVMCACSGGGSGAVGGGQGTGDGLLPLSDPDAAAPAVLPAGALAAGGSSLTLTWPTLTRQLTLKHWSLGGSPPPPTLSLPPSPPPPLLATTVGGWDPGCCLTSTSPPPQPQPQRVNLPPMLD